MLGSGRRRSSGEEEVEEGVENELWLLVEMGVQP
jgi:hypothetical protein